MTLETRSTNGCPIGDETSQSETPRVKFPKIDPRQPHLKTSLKKAEISEAPNARSKVSWDIIPTSLLVTKNSHAVEYNVNLSGRESHPKLGCAFRKRGRVGRQNENIRIDKTPFRPDQKTERRNRKQMMSQSTTSESEEAKVTLTATTEPPIKLRGRGESKLSTDVGNEWEGAIEAVNSASANLPCLRPLTPQHAKQPPTAPKGSLRPGCQHASVILRPSPASHQPSSFRRTETQGKEIAMNRRLRSSAGRSDISQRPVSRARGPPYHNRSAGPVVSRHNDWMEWIELGVRVSGLPTHTTTRDLWKAFRNEGSISSIELFEDRQGNREGRAEVRFSPPPSNPFWRVGFYLLRLEWERNAVRVTLELRPQRRTFLMPSPVNPKNKYPELMSLSIESLDFGFMYTQENMMSMQVVSPPEGTEITFRQKLQYREIDVTFSLVIEVPQRQEEGQAKHLPPGYLYTKSSIERYRFQVPFAQLRGVREVQMGEKIALVLSVDSPPKFCRKRNEADTHHPASKSWYERNSWSRQTDIVHCPQTLNDTPVALKKPEYIVDIGRWTTYLLTIDISPENLISYSNIRKALRDFNIEITPFPRFGLILRDENAVWDHIDMPVVQSYSTRSALEELTTEAVPQLSFPIRYQLEACISHGCLNEHNLSQEFVSKLRDMDETKAKDMLEYVATRGQRVYNPMEIFTTRIIKGSASSIKIPHYCTHTRSATITPSTIYFNTPTVEISNRVVRQYAQFADRFLRVRFTDEISQGRVHSSQGHENNQVYFRIKRVLKNGITIGDRKYEFLAFGNSQFREHGAYFFAPLDYLRAEDIRAWMGDLKEIDVPAKYAARQGQCFSTTRAINGTKVNIVEIMDVVRGECTFTDGVGKISKFLATIVASELGVTHSSGDPPSVFQFRLGGCKGVLAMSPDINQRDIHIRKSQYKFPAVHEGLEIIRWSQFSTANLNRQLILVLSALGVPEEIFTRKLKQQLLDLEQAMFDEELALRLLQKEVDPNQATLVLAGMITDGFHRLQEPFMLSLLRLWRAWSIKYLKEKARIVIHEGALLLGCTDETQALKGHFDDIHSKGEISSSNGDKKCLPEVFVQLSRGPGDKPLVIEGEMLLARNPSLHPGDVRLVLGVDVPALRHLKDVVVFPQTGDRDLPGMCSGGDLDGDDFIVIWDKDLIPSEWNHEPMNYESPKPVRVERQVTTDDIVDFFVNYLRNDSLSLIALAHIAFADSKDEGVKDEKCLRLAALHSTAVDYPKTGVPAYREVDLYPQKWPHFMGRPLEKSYISRKVLGKLYDQVERVDFAPVFECPFDNRILNAFELDGKLLRDATELKEQYDEAMRRIMAQHQIDTEHEVWSTFVLRHSDNSGDFKFHEEIGELSNALKDRFRHACYEKAGGKEYEKIGPFVAAMYKVTSDEISKASRAYYQAGTNDSEEVNMESSNAKSMPFMSFPWIFQGVLGKIANGAIKTSKAQHEDFIAETSSLAPKRNRANLEPPNEEDVLQTSEGMAHRGDLLVLFEDVEESKEANKEGSGSRVYESLELLERDIVDHEWKQRDIQEAARRTEQRSQVNTEGTAERLIELDHGVESGSEESRQLTSPASSVEQSVNTLMDADILTDYPKPVNFADQHDETSDTLEGMLLEGSVGQPQGSLLDSDITTSPSIVPQPKELTGLDEGAINHRRPSALDDLAQLNDAQEQDRSEREVMDDKGYESGSDTVEEVFIEVGPSRLEQLAHLLDA